jgi:hypothetical protein
MTHFHIRWSNGKLDWQRFETQVEAESSANDLVLPEESFTLEQFDSECPVASSAE